MKRNQTPPRVIVHEEGGRTWLGRFTLVTPFCEICLRTGDGQREADWRVIELDGEPHCFCPRHFPPSGSPAAKFEAAYRECFQEMHSRRQLVVNCIEAVKQLAAELHPSNQANLYELLAERFGDWRRTLNVAARKRIVPQELEVAGLVAEMRMRLTAGINEGRIE